MSLVASVRTAAPRARRLGAALGAAVLGLAVVTAGANDASAHPVEHADDDRICVDDTRGDPVEADSGDPVAESRADIVEYCVAYGPTLSVQTRLARHSVPADDVNWTGDTVAGWVLDVDADGEGEYLVELERRGNALAGTVTDVRDAEDPRQVCTAAAVATSLTLSVNAVPRSCIGDPDEVAIDARIRYDQRPEMGEDGVVAVDTGPGDTFETRLAGDPSPREPERHAGADRIDTSVAISRAEFGNPAFVDVVFLARDGRTAGGDGLFADAVAGGVLQRGPILLVPSCGGVPQVVADEIDRLGPDRVVALGGDGAVCRQTLEEAADGRPTDRLAGATRVETAVAISRFRFRHSARAVYLARAEVFADAAVGGTVTDGPVLLVPSCGEVPDAVRAEMDRLDPDRVWALGGTVAICEDTLADAADDRPRGRLAGPDRVGTAVEIARHVFPGFAADRVRLARADVLSDAIAGGILTDGPILLVPPCGAPPEAVGAEVSRLNPAHVAALGGAAAVCDRMLETAASL